MKKYFTIFFFFVFMINFLSAKTLDTYLTINRFFEIETNQNYIEISYFVPVEIVKFEQNTNQKFQAKLRTEIKISNSKNVQLKNETYILQTKEYSDLKQVNVNLEDVIRLIVPTGDTLKIEIVIEDVNSIESKFISEINVFIPDNKEAFLSDIMLTNTVTKTKKNSPFSRNNLIVKPKFLNYYPTEIESISFYSEFYQLNNQDNYFCRYLLTDEEGIFIDGYASLKRIENKQYDVIISGFNISKLPSGNYYLFMELKDSKNNVVDIKRTFFQRNNKNENIVENINDHNRELDVITNNFAEKYNIENIRHHCLALMPIATNIERSTIESFENSEDIDQMHNYFYRFWKEKNSDNPESAWIIYAKKLQFVENAYTNLNERGYETTRGIIYLKYGKPFYEKLLRKKVYGEFWVWNYERINNEGNVYFIFQNVNDITDDFKLVHTSLKGSVYNKNWADYIKNEL